MAAIDALLKLIEAQKAEALVLNTGKPPALVNGGVPKPLSMPPLNSAIVNIFVKEVFTPEQLEEWLKQRG